MENRLLLFVAWGRISCPHEAVILCGAIMRFVGETLAPGDSTRRRLVGASGNSNRVLSRSPMVLWEKVRFCVRGIAGVTSSDLAFMAELDGGFGGEAEWRIRNLEGDQDGLRDLMRPATTLRRPTER